MTKNDKIEKLMSCEECGKLFNEGQLMTINSVKLGREVKICKPCVENINKSREPRKGMLGVLERFSKNFSI